MQAKFILEMAKRAGKMLLNNAKNRASDNGWVVKSIIWIVGLFLVLIILTAGVIMGLYRYFMCTGLMGWFNKDQCEEDPIPNSSVERLAELMYNQRKDAGVPDGMGQFRLASEAAASTGGGAGGSTAGSGGYSWKADSKNPNTIGAGDGHGGMMTYVEAAYNDMSSKFSGLTFMGGFNDRNVRGGNTKSQHAYGNAFDVGASPETMAQIAEYMKSNPAVKYVIYNHQISKDGGDWEPYNGVNPHTDHVHADFKKVTGAGSQPAFGPGGTQDTQDAASGEERSIEAIDEAEIWVRILAQIDLMKMEKSEIIEKNFAEGGEYEGTNLHKTYKIAKEKHGNRKDFQDRIYYYMMKVRFDVYACYFLADNAWFVEQCNGNEIANYINDEDEGVVPMTVSVKVGEEEQKEFKYTKRELLDHFEAYSLASPEHFKYWVEYYLNSMFEGMYGPETGSMLIPSATWLVPMEPGTYNFASPFRPPHRPEHNGVDMGNGGVHRVPVYASASGVVISAGRNTGGYGGIVTIDHKNGYFTQYSHFWKEDIVVRKGQTVQQGQLLGGSGNDMDGDAWHLHFEICKVTRPMNGAELSPGKGQIVGCSEHLDPESKEFGMNFRNPQDGGKTQERASKFDSEWKKKALGGEVILMPGFTPSGGLGSLSAKYENNDPEAGGKCSSGVGDPGGVSCGVYQIATNPGSLKEFVNLCKSTYPQFYAALNPLEVGSSAFVKKWGELYKQDPVNFMQAQHNYIHHTHYVPIVSKIKSVIGMDVTQKHFAIQEMTWSMAVQHRNNTDDVFLAVLGKEGWKSMSDAEIITKVYDERIRRWPKLSKRFKAEKQDALNLLGAAN